MRVMTLDTVCCAERLVLMCFLQSCVLWVVAIHAQRRRRLRQVVVKLRVSGLPRLVRHMAGLATHVQSCVPASVCGHIQPGRVTAQAKILSLIPGGRFQQLEFVVGRMWVMAL